MLNEEDMQKIKAPNMVNLPVTLCYTLFHTILLKKLTLCFVRPLNAILFCIISQQHEM